LSLVKHRRANMIPPSIAVLVTLIQRACPDKIGRPDKIGCRDKIR